MQPFVEASFRGTKRFLLSPSGQFIAGRKFACRGNQPETISGALHFAGNIGWSERVYEGFACVPDILFEVDAMFYDVPNELPAV